MGDDSQQVKRVPHLPWMRNPVDIEQFEERPLGFLPSLDPRFVLSRISCCYSFGTLFASSLQNSYDSLEAIS